MCLAIPGKLMEVPPEEDALALVEVCGVRRRVDIGLLRDESPRVGDWVLIHVGFAMSKISEEQAGEQVRMLEILGENEEAMREANGYGGDDSGPLEGAP